MISSKKKYLTLAVLLVCGSTFMQQLFADTTYKVQKGDTLFSISRKLQITVNELRVANNLPQSGMIKIGQTLIIPTADITTAASLNSKNTQKTNQNATTPSTQSAQNNKNQSAPVANKSPTKQYTIQKGDTLYGIARKMGVKVSTILSLNNIDTSSTIKAGQKLLIPTNASPNAPSTTPASKAAMAAANKEARQKERLASAKGVVWPLENPKVKNISGKVSGVELTGSQGEAVKSVREGTVMYTGVYRGFGQVIFVQSKTGLIYSYSGLKQVDAKKGDYVTMGSKIGTLGTSGDTSIKFMVFQNGVPLDPISAPRG